MTANKIIAPPIKPYNDGLSLTNKKAHNGPRTDSDNIIIPTVAEGVVLAPIVININPKPTWKNPAKNPRNMSWFEIIIFVDNK